jgi:cytoskeletal protein CcmA (bactofilin family)
MFAKKPKTRAAEPTVIGKGTTVEGTIRAAGSVQVDGQIDGALIADGHVSIGPNGSIIGELVADDLAISGRVEGRVCVRNHLYVAPGAIASGEVRYGSLQVERGGVIDGSALHGEMTITMEPPTLPEDVMPMPAALPVRGTPAPSTP